MEDSFIDPDVEAFPQLNWRRITPQFTPRVYEIDGAAALARLTEQYPIQLSDGTPVRTPYQQDLLHWFEGHRLYEPHWPSVAQDFDVVHVTQLAYLECAYALIPCLDGVTTLTGRGPDAATWLRDPLPASP